MEVFHTKTFAIEDNLTAQALKTMEETAEFFMAARSYERDKAADSPFVTTSMQMAIDEGADVIQTVLNAFDMMGLYPEDVEDAMERCLKRNQVRGRVE